MQQSPAAESASRLIDQRIREVGGWRGEILARMRALILEADPEMIEECKWVKPSNPMGVPVWSHHGIVCTGEVYAKAVKLTFAKGAKLPDPARLFNSSLDGNTRRAIDIHEGEKIDARAFKALVKAAVALNSPPAAKKAAPTAMASPRGSTPRASKQSTAAPPTAVAASKATKAAPKAGALAKRKTSDAAPARGRTGAKPAAILSGGNPRMAKADGDAPVQAYIAAMPGWKRDVGRRLDAIIVRSVPGVRKAVKWNSPFYGVEGRGWFLSFHVFTRYVKVVFFQGASLRPVPPGPSKSKDARYLDIHEGDVLGDAQLASWAKQAAKLPGFLGPAS